MPKASLLTVLGIGLESVQGTAVTASTFIPVTAAPKPDDKLKMDMDKSWRGAMGTDYNTIPGVRSTTFDFDGNAYADVVGFPLAGILGDVSYSGTAGASTTSTGATVVGATSITVTSATGIVAGTVIAIDTAVNQEFRTVTSVSTNTLTVPALNVAHASGVAVVVNTAPYTTTFSLLNSGQGQPPSYTLSDWYNVNGRQYPGCVFSDVSFKLPSDGLVTYAAKMAGYPSIAGLARPTASYSSVQPFSGWQGATTFGSPLTSQDNVTVTDATIDLKRKVDVINTADGVQAPYNIFAGELSASGKMTVVMESDAQLTAYLNNSQPSLNIAYNVSSSQSLQFHINKCAYTATTINRSKDYVEADITYTALLNSTDVGASGVYSPVKVTLVNNFAPGQYK